MFKKRLFLSLAALVAVQAAQALSPYERDNWYGILFTDSSTFSDATFQGDIYQYWTGSAGDTFDETFDLAGNSVANYWIGDGTNIPVTNFSATPGVASATINDLTGDPGSTDLDFGYAVSAGSSSVATGVYGGFNDIEGSFVSSGGVVDSGTEVEAFYFSGDWSNQGIGTGMSELVSYNSAGGWTISQDFVYDSTTNLTYLTLINPDYLGEGNNNVDVTWRLFGSSAVPGPEAFVPFVIGGIAALRRRRK